LSRTRRLPARQIGQDLDTRKAWASGTFEAQAEKAMANIDLLLRDAGSGCR